MQSTWVNWVAVFRCIASHTLATAMYLAKELPIFSRKVEVQEAAMWSGFRPAIEPRFGWQYARSISLVTAIEPRYSTEFRLLRDFFHDGNAESLF